MWVSACFSWHLAHSAVPTKAARGAEPFVGHQPRDCTRSSVAMEISDEVRDCAPVRMEKRRRVASAGRTMKQQTRCPKKIILA